ncbi:DUF1573 domain-containing protein [Sanyastnella coralliicola]|uniref:DUF1573 domain-containing protein n=1 Tax=Sanyastnella coralliicola TaxID=3069118 RepID=UPI0027BA46A5|nr:DUF1573 domain-containing protein [Longitalea sp. SCSIO 12813]
MNNGLKIGLLAVIAVLLGVIAYKMYNSSAEEDVYKPMAETDTQVNNNASDRDEVAQPAAYDPLKDQKAKQQEAAKSNIPSTTMSFISKEWDFGVLDEGDRVEHVFQFTNTGDNPLILEKCKGSCGCTVPECPKEPIAPGASGEIKVAFNSKGKKNMQTKKVTITANTESGQEVLTIRANVTPAAQ